MFQITCVNNYWSTINISRIQGFLSRFVTTYTHNSFHWQVGIVYWFFSCTLIYADACLEFLCNLNLVFFSNRTKSWFKSSKNDILKVCRETYQIKKNRTKVWTIRIINFYFTACCPGRRRNNRKPKGVKSLFPPWKPGRKTNITW